jgi:hypothetical protein
MRLKKGPGGGDAEPGNADRLLTDFRGLTAKLPTKQAVPYIVVLASQVFVGAVVAVAQGDLDALLAARSEMARFIAWGTPALPEQIIDHIARRLGDDLNVDPEQARPYLLHDAVRNFPTINWIGLRDAPVIGHA